MSTQEKREPGPATVVTISPALSFSWMPISAFVKINLSRFLGATPATPIGPVERLYKAQLTSDMARPLGIHVNKNLIRLAHISGAADVHRRSP